MCMYTCIIYTHLDTKVAQVHKECTHRLPHVCYTWCVHSELHIATAPCTMHTTYMHHACTMHHAPCTMHHSELHMATAPCTMHHSTITNCTLQLHHVPCTVYYQTPCTMHHSELHIATAPCTMYHVPCTMHNAPCRANPMYHAPYRANCTLHIAWYTPRHHCIPGAPAATSISCISWAGSLGFSSWRVAHYMHYVSLPRIMHGYVARFMHKVASHMLCCKGHAWLCCKVHAWLCCKPHGRLQATC